MVKLISKIVCLAKKGTCELNIRLVENDYSTLFKKLYIKQL